MLQRLFQLFKLSLSRMLCLCRLVHEYKQGRLFNQNNHNLLFFFVKSEMCPKPNHTNFASSVTSHVEELTEATPELFQVLTEDQDRLQRWISLTYPIDLNFINSLSPVSNHEVDASSTPLPLVCIGHHWPS